ncbi:MAG: hypothetical protein ACI4C3_06350, partial [Bacteroides sp.]
RIAQQLDSFLYIIHTFFILIVSDGRMQKYIISAKLPCLGANKYEKNCIAFVYHRKLYYFCA